MDTNLDLIRHKLSFNPDHLAKVEINHYDKDDDIISLAVAKGCVTNSFLIAHAIADCEQVYGAVICYVDTQPPIVIEHVWNCMGGQHFDLTYQNLDAESEYDDEYSYYSLFSHAPDLRQDQALDFKDFRRDTGYKKYFSYR
jgi:hypothetical protein